MKNQKNDTKRYITYGYDTLYGYNTLHTLNRAYTTILNAPLTTLIQSPSYVYAKRSEDEDGSVPESSNENVQSGDKDDNKRAIFLDYEPMTLLGGSQVTLLDGYQRAYLISKRGSQKDEHDVHDGLVQPMETSTEFDHRAMSFNGVESQEETSSVRPRDVSQDKMTGVSGNGQKHEKSKPRPSVHSMAMGSDKINNAKNNGQNQRNN